MTTEKKKMGLEIKTPTMSHIKVKVRGISPMIYEKFSAKSKNMMLEKMLGNKIERPPKDPEKEYQDSIYWYDKKKKIPGAKAIWFKCGMVDWAKQSKEGAAIRRCVFVGKTFDGHELLPVKPSNKNDPHTRLGEDETPGDMVRNQTGVADIRFRGELSPGWEVEIPISFYSSEISAEKIISLLNTAGMSSGCGGWRPQKGGVNGMYKVVQR